MIARRPGLASFAEHVQGIVDNQYQLRYHSLHDNQYLRYFKGHTGRITTIAMSPKNDMFMSAAEVLSPCTGCAVSHPEPLVNPSM